MKSYLLPLLLLLTLLMKSCFIADTLLVEPKPELTLPFDVVVKDSVYQYIQRTKSANERYLSYGYEPFKVIVPETVMELEKWQDRRGRPGFSADLVNQKIAYYDSIKDAKNLSRKVTIEHTFSLRGLNDSVGAVQKANFVLSNNLEVIDFMPSYQTNLSKEEEGLFAKFFYQTPILKAYSYEESQKLSKEFYNFFKVEMQQKNSTLERGRFLKHVLKVLKTVDANNLFEVQKVSQSMVQDYFREQRKEIQAYLPINFSPLYEIKEGEELTGYYFFHTFSYQFAETTERLSVYVKFSPFYEVERVIETNQQYEVYED